MCGPGHTDLLQGCYYPHHSGKDCCAHHRQHFFLCPWGLEGNLRRGHLDLLTAEMKRPWSEPRLIAAQASLSLSEGLGCAFQAGLQVAREADALGAQTALGDLAFILLATAPTTGTPKAQQASSHRQWIFLFMRNLQ